MIKKEAKLNPKIFDRDIESVPIRQGFGEGLLLAGRRNKNIVALSADLTESTKINLFKEEFPERFVEMGVAEQNLASVASGMASMGKLPVISSYAMFSPGRNWEQIRTTICYNDRKVIIAGSHAGVSVGPDGGTHQAIEDIALMRVIPNITVISPCDTIEARKAIIASLSNDIKTPVYIRLAREKTPVMTSEDSPFEIGKAEVVYESKDPQVTIIATGALLYKAIIAANLLQNDDIGSIVVNLSTIKPLDEETVIASIQKTNALVTVEEHQIAGGMGSAISECLAQTYPVPIEFVGVRDQFGQSGTPEELINHYGMDVKDIRNAALSVIQRKK